MIESQKLGSKEGESGGIKVPAIAKQEKRKFLAGITIEDMDTNDSKRLGEVLAMLKDESNRDHLADISDRTSLQEIINYYSDKSRKARVALGKEGAVIGIYDISGNPPSNAKTLPSEARPNVSIVSGWLQRLCVKPDHHKKGLGSLLIEDGEKKALGELGFAVLRAAIVLSEEQMDLYQAIVFSKDQSGLQDALDRKGIKLFTSEIGLFNTLKGATGVDQQMVENIRKTLVTDIFLDWLGITDPRGRAFLKNRGWRMNTVFREQTRVESTGKDHPVLIVEKYRSDWEQERKEEGSRPHKKVIDTENTKGIKHHLL